MNIRYIFSIYIIGKKRVDMYLSTLFENYSRSFIQRIIDKGYIKVNGKVINKNIKIKNKDLIEINIITEKLDLEPQKMNLDIIYEDSDILVINKDYGVNVHPVPGEGGKKGTLVNGILDYCKDKLPIINGVERPGIVHRLDKDTSGTILIAKNDNSMRFLANIIKNRQISKYYIAIVYGIVSQKQFKIESYIGRDPNNRQKMTTKNPINPKIAITYGEVLRYLGKKFTVLKLKIETGRTHQIRVHLASIGYPIIGDKVYGNQKINKKFLKEINFERQALHSWKIIYNQNGQKKEFYSKLKNDMKKLISFIL